MEDTNVTPVETPEEDSAGTGAIKKSNKKVWIILGVLIVILIGLISVFIGQTKSEVVDNPCIVCDICGECYYPGNCEECNAPEICPDLSCGECSECLKENTPNVVVNEPAIVDDKPKEPEKSTNISYVSSEQNTIDIPEGAINDYNISGIYETKIGGEIDHPSIDGVIHTGALNWFQKDCEEFTVYSKNITNNGDSVILTLTIKSAYQNPIRLYAPTSISVNGYSIPISGLEVNGLQDGTLSISKQATMDIELYNSDLISSGIDKIRTIDIHGLSVADAASGAVFFIEDFTLKTSYSGSTQGTLKTYGNLVAVGADSKVQAIQSDLVKNSNGNYVIPITVINDSDLDIFIGTSDFRVNGIEQSDIYSTNSTVSSKGTTKCNIIMPIQMMGITEDSLEEIKFKLFLRSSNGSINILEDITLKVVKDADTESNATVENN